MVGISTTDIRLIPVKHYLMLRAFDLRQAEPLERDTLPESAMQPRPKASITDK